jgi:multidrug efflux pump
MNISANISEPFIRRPVATSLVTIAILLAGIIGFKLLPVAPLPQVDFPTISVSAGLPGASPETMASAVATPLERQLGHIASLTQMTSSSSLGSTNINLQFDLNRDINAAARDVQAAINAARTQLPADIPSQPSYRKINPADYSIIILALTSQTMSRPDIYDAADSILAQKLAQIDGVGQVNVSGGAQPAVRVEANPMQLNSYGVSLEQVRNALASANANAPKGSIETDSQTYQLNTTDQLFKAREYRPLFVTYHNGAPVRVQDVAQVSDSVLNTRNAGISNGQDAILIFINRQPGANIVDTVDRIRAALPVLEASIPPAIKVSVVNDRTTTIRASIEDVEISLGISICLVILVVFAFLRNAWATIIPSISVPLSLIGTFGIMYLLGYTLDNLSLMALTISTGFVVDDAIVVIENIARHLEGGMRPFEAALQGSREIGFTVISMSTSLIAVFIPILMMAGIVGRLFREFAVTLSAAIAVSLFVSLTTTPMMCARFLKHDTGRHNRAYRAAERFFQEMLDTYDRGLRWVLRHQPIVLGLTILTVCVSVALAYVIPKGFFPQQDTGRVSGSIVADQHTSFAAITDKMKAFEEIVRNDPAVDTVMAFSGGGADNQARMFSQLKPLDQRGGLSADQVIDRLRGKLSKIPGATLFLQVPQDISVGARGSNSQFQYTLQSEDLTELDHWAPIMLDRLKKIPELQDPNSDEQDHGLSSQVVIDRDAAYRMGINMSTLDNILNDAFGQRQVSIMYRGINQYHVVLEVAPQFQQSPDALHEIFIPAGNTGGQSGENAASGSIAANGGNFVPGGTSSVAAPSPMRNAVSSPYASSAASGTSSSSSPATGSAGTSSAASSTINPNTITALAAQPQSGYATPVSGALIPLSAVAHYVTSNTALQVNHQGIFPAITLSFNLAPNASLGTAVSDVLAAQQQADLPSTVQATFQGTAQAFQQSLASEPLLILTAIAAVYIVLGILYESYVHPITILSTLPSAGVGALLALFLFKDDLNVIALIGIILLIGIVKKNAILMIDFAIQEERIGGKSPIDAIYQACLLRFRPIMMTTMAALFGAVPLAVGRGTGSELRRPLGITIVGGLILSQMLTLFTTPVVYLYLDRLQTWRQRHRAARLASAPADAD